MKKIKISIFVAIISIVLSSTAFGQKTAPELPFDSLTNKITYSEVIFVDSLVTKQELFLRAREWFAKAYNSANDVIQMEEEENGIIVGKAMLPVTLKTLGVTYDAGNIHYTISIYLKEGRYKYVITDFYHTGNPTRSISDYGVCENMINSDYKISGISQRKNFHGYLYQMDENIKNLIKKLKKFMETSTKNASNDDW